MRERLSPACGGLGSARDPVRTNGPCAGDTESFINGILGARTVRVGDGLGAEYLSTETLKVLSQQRVCVCVCVCVCVSVGVLGQVPRIYRPSLGPPGFSHQTISSLVGNVPHRAERPEVHADPCCDTKLVGR